MLFKNKWHCKTELVTNQSGNSILSKYYCIPYNKLSLKLWLYVQNRVRINQLKRADISFCVTNDDDVFEKLQHYYTCIMLSQRKTYLYNVKFG